MSTEKILESIDEILKNGSSKINSKNLGTELLNKFRKEVESNHISNMTLDEINSEITNYRSDKINKCKDSNRNNEDLNKFISMEKTNCNKQLINEYLSESRQDRTF